MTRPRLALCPICELPHADLMMLATPSGPIDVIGTTCAAGRPMVWQLPVRAVLMTENHDPGDEHDGACA